MTKAFDNRKLIISLVAVLIMVLFSSYSYAAATSTVKMSRYTAPTTISHGRCFILKGTLTSNYTIKRVEIGVVGSNGKWTSQKYDNKNVKSKSFNIARADNSIKFGKLGVGSYYYRIYAHTSDGKVHTVLNKNFKVTKVKTVTKAKTVTNSAKKTSKITLSGVNKPKTYIVGTKFNPVGTIKTTEPIKRIEVGIVFAPTGKWLLHKYDTNNLNSKSFNISKAAPKLQFDQLPAGTFIYRIYVHTRSGVYTALNHKFEVKTNGKPQKALNWAKKIANDNSFTYGKKPATSRVGCYFCGTNKGRKPKGYEKTYVCMPFIHAAYAHGVNDPEMLSDCKSGRCCIGLNDWNFMRYSCWEKIGLCKDLTVNDLLPGDVIIWWADDDYSGHASMYAGNGNIVDAAIEGWGVNSIAVRNGYAENYLKTGAKFSSKSYVMRYRK